MFSTLKKLDFLSVWFGGGSSGWLFESVSGRRAGSVV